MLQVKICVLFGERILVTILTSSLESGNKHVNVTTCRQIFISLGSYIKFPPKCRYAHNIAKYSSGCMNVIVIFHFAHTETSQQEEKVHRPSGGQCGHLHLGAQVAKGPARHRRDRASKSPHA